MEAGKTTLGIYGIPDRNDLSYPEESHDHGIVLMDQGKIVNFLQLERMTRKKHDHRLPEFLFGLLKEEGLLAGDFDIAFSNNVLGNSMISSNGKIRLEGPLCDQPAPVPLKAHAWWLDRAREAWMVNHELAHIFSAMPFYGRFPDNSLLIHFDGGASTSNFSAFSFREEKINLIEAHWDLKHLSAFFNANALCFGIIGAQKEEQLSVPGKLMGLAAMGSWSGEIEKWLKRNQWFANIWGSKKDFFNSAEHEFGWRERKLDPKDPFLQDIVATLHEIFVREVFEKIINLSDRFRTEDIVFTGGSALNIVLNSRLSRAGISRRLMIPPCTNDSGLALGSAACLEWYKHGKIEKSGPYLENWNTGGKNSGTLQAGHTENDVAKTASWINQEEIVGVCNGPGEAGPRALGNRSILCRADKPELARKLSMELKGREWYRPLAPIMRKEKLEKYTGEKNPSSLGKFMLDEFRILPKSQQSICGAVHIDSTARIQFLEYREDNPYIWDLLMHLENNYNLDCLINTSFNVRGEPIVETQQDALKTAEKMNLRKLVIEGKPITLKSNGKS